MLIEWIFLWTISRCVQTYFSLKFITDIPTDIIWYFRIELRAKSVKISVGPKLTPSHGDLPLFVTTLLIMLPALLRFIYSIILSESDVILGWVCYKIQCAIIHFQWQKVRKQFLLSHLPSLSVNAPLIRRSTFDLIGIIGRWLAQGRFHWTNLHNGFLGNYVYYIVFGIRSGNVFFFFFGLM